MQMSLRGSSKATAPSPAPRKVVCFIWLVRSFHELSLSALYHTAAAQTPASDSSPAVQTPGRRGPRVTRKINAQATKLESIDDSVDPLGPLGEAPVEDTPTPADEAPAPPQKEPFAGRGARPLSSRSQAPGVEAADSANLEEESAVFRGPPPVQPPVQADGPKRQTQPSMSVEQAAKPTFHIYVGDPHKVGDLTSSHIVYQVSTKVTGHTDMKFTVEKEKLTIIYMARQLLRPIANLSSPLAVDTVISSGSTTPCTAITREWLLRLRLRSKLLADLIPTL